MSKKEFKKEIKRLNKIIDALLVLNNEKKSIDSSEVQAKSIVSTNDSTYIGGRPNDRP